MVAADQLAVFARLHVPLTDHADRVVHAAPGEIKGALSSGRLRSNKSET